MLEVRNIVKRYGSVTAVNGVSFSVNSGEIFGLLGPNGAGKSTTIRMLTTLTKPTAGELFVDGYSVVKQQVEVKRVLPVIRFEKDLPMRKIQSVLAASISQAMLFDKQLKMLHSQNKYKPYVFCAPYPLEPDRIYRRERMYCFHLRTRDLAFASAMKAYLPRIKKVLKVVSIELRSFSQAHINELVSLTPIVATVNNRCWMPENGLGLLADRLHGNAAKKCKVMDASFAEPDELFFDRLELLNHKPIVVGYKATSLLGHKVRLGVKPNAWAQQLAFTALSGGLGEKNAIGFGYCIAK